MLETECLHDGYIREPSFVQRMAYTGSPVVEHASFTLSPVVRSLEPDMVTLADNVLGAKKKDRENSHIFTLIAMGEKKQQKKTFKSSIRNE